MYGDGSINMQYRSRQWQKHIRRQHYMEKMLPSETEKAFLPIFKDLYEYGSTSAIFIIKAEY